MSTRKWRRPKCSIASAAGLRHYCYLLLSISSLSSVSVLFFIKSLLREETDPEALV